ncbi:MAG: DUF2271 domain-containing protein [Planctomyces sp.]|nr:DUF2271 domain-containing protein [Planctomyces sp.]
MKQLVSRSFRSLVLLTVLASISGHSNSMSIVQADEKKEETREPESDVKAGMVLEITINRPEGGGRGYRRPYVSAWLTDKDGVPVRTIFLWVQKAQPGPRWIPDLRQWNRDDRLRRLVDDRDLVDAIAAPTRNAGLHKVVWDGKDDQGNALPAGTYTLNIEAAREHGTYQIIREKIELGDSKFQKSLDGNVEIKAVKIDYRGLAGK